MRAEFRADLLELGRLLVSMAEAVRTAMRNATAALLTADLAAAEEVVVRDAEVDALYRQVEERVQQVLARQQPVAGDLRLVVTALHIAADLERMGDLAEHVARTARRRHPVEAVPGELRPVVSAMADIAERMAGKIAWVLSAPDATRAAELERDDDAMDALHRQLFSILLGPEWAHGVGAAVDAALLGRFYERYADHAVNTGKHVVYLVTGETAGSGPDPGTPGP
jgi:phosphate transport system protein